MFEARDALEPATIVFCIEAGWLEAEALLMVKSLRKWGGRLGESRVLAVVPRKGTGPSRKSIAALEELNVEVIDGSAFNHRPWYNFNNKVVGVLVAEEVAETPAIVWLDSDVLFLSPPEGLGLFPGEEFAARRETLPPNESEDDGPFARTMRWSCDAVGVPWREIPRLPASAPFRAQRMHLNAGVYAFRNGMGFATTYAGHVDVLIERGVTLEGGNYYFNEQAAVMLTAVGRRLRFRELSVADHHMVFPAQIDLAGSPSIADSHLIHYSASMSPTHWPRLMERFRRERPEHYEWLHEHGPIDRKAPPATPSLLVHKVSRKLRGEIHRWKCLRAESARVRVPARHAAIGRPMRPFATAGLAEAKAVSDNAAYK
ncbi:hypothetical protein [Paludisphaera rhizosphaerae]|uniref:hypothetical protein n=1 Tax=Paludisphaera rhizosphaerae TaxID=2711216 RepID=UPI0013EBAC47|nr:hypothetical protein [Paludisphaera rhizosphaerae]